MSQPRATRLTDALALSPNIVAVSAAMFLMGLGENLWRRFLPKYLQLLGAPVTAIGLFGSVEDFLDGVYQHPGGWLADRFGRRRAMLLFVALATIGYAVYWAAPSWRYGFLALVFTMAWTSMASPMLFAVVGDSLPPERRTMGFTVQSVLRRVPIAIVPTLGGVAVAALGLRAGMRVGLSISIALAIVMLGVAARIRIPVLIETVPTNIVGVWRSLPRPLRWLSPRTSSSARARAWSTCSSSCMR